MKKILLFSLIALALTFAAQARSSKKEITVSDQKIERAGDQVTVHFRMDAGKRAARKGRTLVYQPVITDGSHSWSLPPVMIRGARARVAEKRHDWAAGRDIACDKYLRGGKSLVYDASAPWQRWMHGADLRAGVMEMGCCSNTQPASVLIAGNLVLPPAVEVVEETVMQIVERPKTTGDRMAEALAYVSHGSEFDELRPGRLFDEDREGLLTIFYRQGSMKLEAGFEGNHATLTAMAESINKLQSSSDSRVNHIVIAGFASPEGAFDLNDRLAWNRAVSVKDYILKNTNMPETKVQLYNGAEDWQGLRMMVERSDMPEKSQVLEIIDNVPIWDSQRKTGRESELMKLNGGRTYRYLYNNFFPKLRNAAYIKIYYENK